MKEMFKLWYMDLVMEHADVWNNETEFIINCFNDRIDLDFARKTYIRKLKVRKCINEKRQSN